MVRESGNISVSTENIFPIIKKWLYSEKDIFVRELVSNSNDAMIKLKKLQNLGEAEVPSDEVFKIKVVVDKDKKTLQISDNGIGMTNEEVSKYINQIAFSGAKDFLEKYKDKADDSQIIGHFGLGFYSAFMVAEKVTIDTLSFVKDSKAVRWTSVGGTEYEIDESDKQERGTTITLEMAEDSLEYLDEYKMRETLKKYFSFLPFEIYLENGAASEKKEDDNIEDIDLAEAENDVIDVTDETKDLEGTESTEGIQTSKETKKKEEPKPLNDISPLWLKNPKDCTDEEYKAFYQKVFMDFNEPLFWIHLNMDYPVNLKGILYFPKLKHEFETNEGQIKLYYNQVFVADNLKEVIPEFLMLLKGCIDCPDLPLNVSRSFLQSDSYVSKISSHITKKVADKLTSIFETEKENYQKYWEDINPFVKYGCIREQKFYDRVKDILIFKNTADEYVTLKEYLERNSEKHKDKVFYVTDSRQQAQYIKMFKENDMEAVVLTTMIDKHFVTFLESKESGLRFARIDADISESFKEKDISADDEKQAKDLSEKLEKLFRGAVDNQTLKVRVENLKTTSVPGMIMLEEHSRRMQEMGNVFGGMDISHMFPKEETLVLNNKNALIQSVVGMMEMEGKGDDVNLICQHIYDLALLSHKQLEADSMTRFIERSNTILGRIV